MASSVHTLFEELTRLGHEVHVWAPKTKGSPRRKNIHLIASMPLVLLKERRLCVYSPALLKRINRYRFDIVHTHTEFAVGILGRTIARMQRCPLVHTYHTIWEDYMYYVTRGFQDNRARMLARRVSRRWCNRCDMIIAPTQKTTDKLRGYGVKSPIRVIPSGLDLVRFDPALHAADRVARRRAEIGVPPGAKVILYLGRISKEKSIEDVMDAMPRVLNRYPETYFVLIGSGPWSPMLEKQAQSLGIASKVIFAGPKPWPLIHEYYAIADVFVSASRSETQGLTYIEALASGVPVVAWQDACLEGVVVPGENGLLCQSLPELADGIERAVSPDGQIMRQQASASVQGFSKAAFAGKMVKAYRQVLSRTVGVSDREPPVIG